MPITVSCSRCGAVYSVPEAQLGQPMWCTCGQSIALPALTPTLGSGAPTQQGIAPAAQPVSWARKFLLGYRAIRIMAVIAVLLWVVASQVKQALYPSRNATPPPAVAPSGSQTPPPPPKMPWPSGSTPMAPSPAQPPPAGTAPSTAMAPGLVIGEPLLPKGTQAKVLALTQASHNSDEAIVEFAWPREPTEEDRDRCFAVVSLDGSQLDMTAMALQGMAGPSPARRGPRDAQLPGPQGVQAASNMGWSTTDQAEATTQRRCRLTVSLADPLGVPRASRPSGPRPVWVSLYDFGAMPPAPLSKPLRTQLVVP